MKSETLEASGIEQRYSEELVGKLGCFDRMIIFGTLNGLRCEKAVARELASRDLGAFDLKIFAEPLTEAIKERARELAEANGVEIRYVKDWKEKKEEIAQACLRERGEKEGLVCILTALEKCWTFAPRRSRDPQRSGWIKGVNGRCLHYYFYFFDAAMGLVHVRVPTWIPMRVHFCFNGHAWLERRLQEQGAQARSVDNAIVETDNWELAQTLSAAPPMDWLEKHIQGYIARCCPHAERFGGYYLTLSQVELSLDLVFRSESVARDLCAQMVRGGILAVRANDVARFFGHQFSPQAEATARFNSVAEGVLCMRHWLNGQSLKLYHKGTVLRLEVTSYDISFFKHHREVVHRNGEKEWKNAPLKKSLFSLGALFGLLEASCRRYLQWLDRLEDPRIGRHNLDEISRPKRDQSERSWRGFNLFVAEDHHALVTLLRGEGLISGWTNRRLRAALGSAWTRSQVSRLLRRLREHQLIRRIQKTFKYYLTALGQRLIVAALKIQEHVILPTLDPSI